MCMHIVEEGFTGVNMSEDHECDDDAFAEYECVEVSQRDAIGNVNAEASESIGASSLGQSGTFIAPLSLGKLN